MATESPSIKIKFKLWRLCSCRLKSVFTRKHPSVGVVKHLFTAKHSGVGVKNLCFRTDCLYVCPHTGKNAAVSVRSEQTGEYGTLNYGWRFGQAEYLWNW